MLPTVSVKLVRYEAARRALAEAHRVDEAKDIRDKAVAMKVYAIMAKDMELIDHATEIKMRAEIRAGQLLVEMKEHGRRQAEGNPKLQRSRSHDHWLMPTLSDLKITKNQSSNWQKIARLPVAEQEEQIATARRKAAEALDPSLKVSRKVSSVSGSERIKVCCESVHRAVTSAMAKMRPADHERLLRAVRKQIDDIENDAAGDVRSRRSA
jgi:hypothetical protein